MMRRLFAILTLAACLTLAGCEINVNRPWSHIELDQNSLTISPLGASQTIGIRGGSGHYYEEISDRTVANVGIEQVYEGGIYLVIEPKKEGEAVVTVTDKESGDFTRLSLKVARYAVTLKIKDVKWAVDAEHPEQIEAALKADASVPPVGGAILTGPSRGDVTEWAFTDAEGGKFAQGTFMQRQLTEAPPIYSTLFPTETQYASLQKWVLSGDDGSLRQLDLFISRATTRMAMPVYYRFSFYEDLTERYKAEFPEAGVRGVARALVTTTEQGR